MEERRMIVLDLGLQVRRSLESVIILVESQIDGRVKSYNLVASIVGKKNQAAVK